MAYRLTAKARRDLSDIWGYIADDNVAAADTFLARLHSTLEILGNNPKAGRRRDEVRNGYRSFPVGDYNIFYRVARPGARIVRIIHGRRDLGKLFTH